MGRGPSASSAVESPEFNADRTSPTPLDISTQRYDNTHNMESVEPRRLAALPGYDTSPDIYETPELTDDTSTTIQTSPRSPDEASDTSEEDDDDEGYGVSRRRLYPERARSRFGATSSRVDTKKVDLSDRVDGRRRGYRVKKKSDDDGEEEGLEARIARLRREIEECRAEADENKGDGQGQNEDMGPEVEGLDNLLKKLEVPKASRQARTTPKEAPESSESPAETNAPDEHILGKVTDFDSRLAALEQALGLSSLETATTESAPTPVLPSLRLLDQQLSALTTAASLTNLDAASSRIEKLRRDAAELTTKGGSRTEVANGSRPSSSDSKESSVALTQEDVQKLHALYQLLPTLQSLSPTVPAMLNRLRSLRTLHTNAANAAAELVEVEKRQAEMDKELKAWKEGLERVEKAVQNADNANGKNGGVVEGWVKDLESRVASSR